MGNVGSWEVCGGWGGHQPRCDISQEQIGAWKLRGNWPPIEALYVVAIPVRKPKPEGRPVLVPVTL